MEDAKLEWEHLQWRKKMNRAKIRGALQSQRATTQKALCDRLVDTSLETARRRMAVITDELRKPLVLDYSALQSYERELDATAKREARDTRRHLRSIQWLETRLKARDAPPAAHDRTTYGLMKESLDDLSAKMHNRRQKT